MRRIFTNEYTFTPSDLKLPYFDFKCLSDSVIDRLSIYDREWLAEWEAWDLAASSIGDNFRSMIRYGHYLGWMAAIKSRGDSLDD